MTHALTCLWFFVFVLFGIQAQDRLYDPTRPDMDMMPGRGSERQLLTMSLDTSGKDWKINFAGQDVKKVDWQTLDLKATMQREDETRGLMVVPRNATSFDIKEEIPQDKDVTIEVTYKDQGKPVHKKFFIPKK